MPVKCVVAHIFILFTAQGDPYYGLPEHLVNDVLNENIELDKQR